MERLIVKVCGMRQAENIREVETLGIDWMGFIFYPKSSRFVREVPDYLPCGVKRVGVFVDASTDEILRQCKRFRLDMVQLHGKESPEAVEGIRKQLPEGVQVIKAFNLGSKEDLVNALEYEGKVDCFLFDAKAPLAGGNGVKFNWSLLAGYSGSTPFLLSGGIGPEDAGLVRSFSHPMLLGVDVNSCFEVSPALKDTSLLKHFLTQLTNNESI